MAVEFDRSALGVESEPIANDVEKGAVRRFVEAIGDGTEDFAGLCEEFDRFLRLAQIAVKIADVVERRGFHLPVRNLAADRERSIVAFERLLSVAEAGVNQAKVVERGGFSVPVVELLAERQCPLVMFDRLSRFANV